VDRLRELRGRIKKEVPFVGIKPFSHNIIGLSLQEIAKKFGTKAANKAIRDFRLTEKGFNEEPENE
jgi:hypothetical protein